MSDDRLFRASLTRPELAGSFDHNGAARLLLKRLEPPEKPLTSVAGLALRVCVIVRREGVVGYISPPIDLLIPNLPE